MLMKKHFFPKTLIGKLIFTLIIMAVYLIGRELPLYGVDLAAYDALRGQSEDLIMQTIGGDRYKTSLFALGISPFMFSTLFIQMAVAFKNADSKSRTSPKKITWATLGLMVVWAIIQAYFTTASTFYIYEGGRELLVAKLISGIQMVTGAFVILFLATRNGKYGIGGQTILIFVNILDSVVSTARGNSYSELKLIGIISFVALMFTIIFENTEYRIPMQRISIHNIYSDTNYIPIKLNPIGMMPVMFSSAFFALPMYVFTGLNKMFPENEDFAYIHENMTTSHTLGIVVYIAILYVITIVFSFVFIIPKNLAENLQKAGDSITGLRAGKKTRRYIGTRVFIISLFSATFMGLFIGLPLMLQLRGMITKEVMSLPSIMIAMASITCNLYRELRAVKDYDGYIPFI